MSRSRASVPSRVFLAVSQALDGDFRGTYGQLAKAIGSHPRAVGSSVRRYARLNPGWDHMRVFSKRTGLPALYEVIGS